MTSEQAYVMEQALCDKSITTHIEPYLTTAELAALLKVRPDTVLHWCSKYRDFPVIRFGRANRYRMSEVVAYFQRPKPRRKRRVRRRYDS